MNTKKEGARILLVDDDPNIVDAARQIFEAAGYVVSTALSGDKALGVARAHRPDVVITDLCMPTMDGFELIRRLKDEVPGGPPPVIVCSAFDLTEKEAISRGAHVFLQKPASAATLIHAVEALLRGSEPEPEAIALERRIVTGARRRRRGDSGTRLRSVSLEDVAQDGRPWLEWLRRYFDCGSAGLFLLELGAVLPVIVVGSEMSQRPEPKLLHLTLAAGIETGTSLVVDDMATHPAFRRVLGPRADIASFAGVPLVTNDGVRVGALCIADSRPGRLDAESLAVMEFLGRRGVSGLLERRTSHLHTFASQAPLLARRTFEMLLASELRIARHLEHAVEVTIANLTPGVSPGTCAEQLWRSGARARLAIGSMGTGRVGLFVRDAAKDARQHVASCLESARSGGLVDAAGVAAITASTGLSRSAVVEIAEGALSVAETATVGSNVERIVVRAERGEQLA
jgi:CheY-like chemotaxis protein